MFRQVTSLAMHGHDNFGPDPIVHLDQLGTARTAGNVNVGLAFGDDPRAHLR